MPFPSTLLHTNGVVATPGYSLFLLPWAGMKTATALVGRAQSSSGLGGGYGNSAGTQNSELAADVWLDTGTYKFALVYVKDSNAGIIDVQLDTVSKGTIDGYAAATAYNTYSELTGIAVTSGLKVFRTICSTKNASSTGYSQYLQSEAWIRTGA